MTMMAGRGKAARVGATRMYYRTSSNLRTFKYRNLETQVLVLLTFWFVLYLI